MVRFRSEPPNTKTPLHLGPALGLVHAPIPSHIKTRELAPVASASVAPEPKVLLAAPLLVQIPVAQIPVAQTPVVHIPVEPTSNAPVAPLAVTAPTTVVVETAPKVVVTPSPEVLVRPVPTRTTKRRVLKRSRVAVTKKKNAPVVSAAKVESPLSALEALAEMYVSGYSETKSEHVANENIRPEPERLNSLVDRSFDEPSLTNDIDANWSVSAAQEGMDETADAQAPLIPRKSMVLGVYEQEEHTDFKKSLNAFRAIQLPELRPVPVVDEKNETRTEKKELASVAPSVEASPTVPKIQSVVASQEKEEAEVIVPADASIEIAEAKSGAVESIGEPILVRPDKPRAPWTKPVEETPAETSGPEIVASQKVEKETASSAPSVFVPPQMVTNQLVRPKKMAIQPTPLANTQAKSESPTQTPPLSTPLVPEPPINTASVDPGSRSMQVARAALPEKSSPSQEVAPNTLVNPALSNPVTPKPQASELVMAQPSALPAARPQPPRKSLQMVWNRPGRAAAESAANLPQPNDQDVGELNGRFTADLRVDEWLANHKGHIELFLEPSQRPDAHPADTQSVGYIYRSQEDDDNFSIVAKRLRSGLYRLHALVFSGDNARLEADIIYRDLIWWGYKAEIEFHVSREDIDHYRKFVQNVPSRTRVLNLSLFEGASGNPDHPTKIANGAVRIVSLPKLGTFYSDSEGNIRIPNVPSKSELLLEVSSQGYHSTEKVEPIFHTDAYDVVYLMSREKVKTITKYFTKNEQTSDKGLIVGRVLDCITRTPKAGETVNLSFRKGPALYIDSLPDPGMVATATTGLFGFFNIQPSFRLLSRVGELIPMLMNIKPDHAQYAESCRAGEHNFHGRIYDLMNGVHPPMKVRMVGQERSEVYTNASGDFTISGIDLPRGTVTLEITGEGYPAMWYTVAWDPAEREDLHHLFVLDSELVKDSAMDVARLKALEPGTGSIIGGAEASLFEHHTGCFNVELEDPKEQKVISEHGPFPWGKPMDGNQLCLTSQNPRFAFYNLPPGEYVLKWIDSNQEESRAHTFYVGMDKVSMVIN